MSMDEIERLSAEAANKIEAAFHCDSRDVRRFAAIIKSAIEKALKWQRDYYGYVLPNPLSRAAHASEIDPVSGYRYDQEIPKPICEMQQIEPAHASEPMRLLDYWYHRGSVSREAYLEIKHGLTKEKE